MNSLDSAFCRRCGVALDEGDVQVAREKLTKLIEQGNVAYNEGRIEEAFEVSETGLISDPSCVAALALKMNCLERRDRIAEALECAERIVELNPDSELDKIKRNQLRRLLEATARDAEPGNRWPAILAGVSAIIIVATVGSYAAIQTRKNQDRALLAQNEKRKPDTGATDSRQPTMNPQANTNPQTQPNTQPTTQSIQQPIQNPTTNRNPVNEGFGRGPKVDEGLPGVGEMRTIEPVHPPAPTGPIGQNNPNTQITNPPPKQDKKDPDDPPQIKPNPPVEAPKPQGTMELTVHTGSGVKTGSEPINDGAGQQALVKTGMSQFQAQNYAAAAKAFERALAAGADPISYGERLGQCYENLGRKAEAIAAYNRGLKACTDALAAGRGDKDKLARKADLYRSRLQVVGG